ncbi:MAG: hypothetical protein B7Z01_14635 [Brevundimonas subvibrioides]|uniref:Amidohydrolase-related domain-containing protein n=1 Tax=Brevundimonas subvibrioides TaxID=74313 RepID=A0A258FCR8_9CAUL|nr:MAG: hypothetical protein B7Z01_14635 [Brevundimonas subvibrioides]
MPRPLHHRPAPARRLARRPEGRLQVRRGRAALSRDHRRRYPRDHRTEPAAPSEGTRRGHDDLQPARLDHGPSRRRRGRVPGLVAGVQRPDRAGLRSLSRDGFIGCNLNPDPGGGHFTAPPLTDRFWYPFYEAMVELDVPAMIHVSGSCNPGLHATGAFYIAADTIAFMQLIQGDLFKDFPTLRLIIPHGGGAVPYHWGRYRGLADMLKQPPLEEHLMDNVFFDTCVYHQPGVDLLTTVIETPNILFGSEMVGAVRGIDPRTGHYFDDTKRYIDNAPITDAQRHAIFEGNARRVFPRLDAKLKERGL